MPFARAVTDCRTCPLGAAAGRDGCPFASTRHPAGRRLVARGRATERVVFIKRGYGVLSAGRGHPFALRAPRSIVGWECLAATRPRHSFTTLTETETCTLAPEEFRAFAKARAAAILPLLATHPRRLIVRHHDGHHFAPHQRASMVEPTMHVLLLRPDPRADRFGLGPFFIVEPLGLAYAATALRAVGVATTIADLRFRPGLTAVMDGARPELVAISCLHATEYTRCVELAATPS